MISLAGQTIRTAVVGNGGRSDLQRVDLLAHRCLCGPVRRFSALWTTGSVSGQRSDGGSFSHSPLADASRCDRSRPAN